MTNVTRSSGVDQSKESATLHASGSAGSDLKPIDRVEYLRRRWQRAKDYHQLNLDNSITNWRKYYAKNPELGLGQYSKTVADKLLEQGRQLVQYNIIQPTVDALAGSLLQMKFDPLFVPINSEVTSLTEYIQKAMYSDKEILDWDATWLSVITGGCVHEGCCKIIIKDNTNGGFSDLGNIGFDYMLPGSTFADPDWKSWRSSDCKRVWHEAWLDVDEMARLYPEQADFLMFHVKREKLDGVTYGDFTGIVPYQTPTGRWGSKYRVIEEYEVVDVKKDVDYLITPAGDIQIPEEIKDMDKPSWLNANYPEWQPDYVYTKPVLNKVCVVRTACPDMIGMDLLQEKPTEVQVRATPFKFWSASRFNGEPHSIVDSIKDAQDNINYWESMIINKLQTEGGGGAQFIEEEMFKDHETYEDFRRHRNNPRKLFPLKAGYISQNHSPIMPVVKSAFPQEAYAHLQHILKEILPSISKVTPATLGRTEPGQGRMAAKLYDQLKKQSDVQSYTLHYGLRMFYNDVYESYLLQAEQTYGNEVVPRVFRYNEGRETIVLNEPVIMEDGTPAIANDVSKLKEIRHKVIICPKSDSPTQQADNVEVFTELIQAIGNNPNKMATVTALQGEIVKNLPNLTVEDKEKYMAIGELETELQIIELEAKKIQAQGMLLQAGSQFQQLQRQMAMQDQGIQPPQQGQLPAPEQQNAGAQAPVANNQPQPAPQAQGA